VSTSNGLKLQAKFVFKASALIHLDTPAQTGAPLSDCRINKTLVMLRETLHGKGSTYGAEFC